MSGEKNFQTSIFVSREYNASSWDDQKRISGYAHHPKEKKTTDLFKENGALPYYSNLRVFVNELLTSCLLTIEGGTEPQRWVFSQGTKL